MPGPTPASLAIWFIGGAAVPGQGLTGGLKDAGPVLPGVDADHAASFAVRSTAGLDVSPVAIGAMTYGDPGRGREAELRKIRDQIPGYAIA